MYQIPPKLKKEMELIDGIAILDVVKIAIFGVIFYLINSIFPHSIKVILNILLIIIIAILFIILIPDPEYKIPIKKWILYFIEFKRKESKYFKKGEYKKYDDFEEEERETK